MSWIDDLNSMQDVGSVMPYQRNPSQPMQPKKETKKKKSFLVDNISTLTGILGGIGGSFVAPIAGTAAGAAGGAALGETLENALTGNSLGENVLKEGIIGGVTSIPPIRAAKAGIGLAKGGLGVAKSAASKRATGAASKQTLEGALSAPSPARVPAQSKATDLGNKILTSQYGTISKPVARATNPEQTFGQLADYGITKPDDVDRLASAITGGDGLISRAVNKAAGNSSRIPTTGIQQVFDDAVELNGLVDKDANSVRQIFRAQMKKITGGPSGSLNPDANPNDVLDVIRSLEKRVADLTGKGSNYRLTNPERADQAKALKAVRDELQDRLDASAPLKSVLTPQLRKELISLNPNNTQWQRFVDSNVMGAKDLRGLRSTMAPFVRGRDIIDEGDINSMTFGGRVGNNFSGAIAGTLAPVLAPIADALQTRVQQPVARTLGSALRKVGGEPGISAAVNSRRPSAAGIAARVGTAGAISTGVNQFQPTASAAGIPQQQSLQPTQQPAPQAQYVPSLGAGEQTQAPNYPLQNALNDITRDPANSDYYMKLYEFSNPTSKSAESPYSRPTSTQYSQANSAVQSIDRLQNMLSGNSSLPGKNTVPGQDLPGVGGFISRVAGTNEYRALTNNILNSIARVNTGAAMPESERSFYESTYLPQPGDPPETIQAKMNTLRQFFSPVLNYQGSSNSPANLLPMGNM